MTFASAIEEPRMQTQTRITRHAPLVGYVSAGNTIEVVDTNETLVVRVTRGTQRFLLLAATIFGPVVTLMLIFARSSMNPHTPAFIKGVLYVVVVAAWLFLFYTLATRPRLEISRASGDIAYYRRGNTAQRVIRRADVARIEVTGDSYVSSQYKAENRVISVVLTNGETVRLCASPDFNLIDSLARQVATLTGTTLLNPTNGQVTQ